MLPLTFASTDLLLEPHPSPEDIQRLLQPIGFENWQTAGDQLRRLAGKPEEAAEFRAILPVLLSSLMEAATPDLALVNLERFAQSAGDRRELYRQFHQQPRTLEILVKLFVGSQFLAEILIANPQYLADVTQRRLITELKSREQFYIDAQSSLVGTRGEEEQFDALRRFQRWELLRIGASDSFGLSDLRTTTVQLSLLADALVQSCLTIAAVRTEMSPAGFTVLAMGKLGGEELNYSSDIDLVFIAAENAPAYWQLGQKLIRGLVHATAHGFLYRVDMRLRPWGKSGALVTSVEGYLDYLRKQAMLWEKQALLKARVIAGDFAVGEEFLKQAQPYLFQVDPAAVRENVRSMKARIEADLEQKGRQWGEVKSGAGSIRDVEFIVQYLQLIHGGKNPFVRTFKTLDALVRLADLSLIQADEYRILSEGYLFFRKVEHSLQLLHYKQDHSLPTDRLELKYLARRLDFPSDAQFLRHYERHCAAVRRIYDRYLGDQRQSLEPASSSGVARHVARLKYDYVATFTQAEIERHAELAERLGPDHLVELEAVRQGDQEWRVTIVAYDYLGELSLICGLLAAHGCDIMAAQIFTYGLSETAPPLPPRAGAAQTPESRQKIVDVFTVQATRSNVTAETWVQYVGELQRLLALLDAGRPAEAQGELVKRVAPAFRNAAEGDPALLPIDVEIDNSLSDQLTVLSIAGRDTLGFLYELTNALALSGIYIAQVRFKSLGDYAYDTLYVTDAAGRKITGEQQQRELRTAIVLTKHFTHLLPRSPNPEAALLHFREFISNLFTQPNWVQELATLERPEVLNALVRLLGASDFLWNDFLRMQHAVLFPVVSDVAALQRPRTRNELQTEIEQLLVQQRSYTDSAAALNAFKDREMFRIDMRFILGLIEEFGRFSEELSDVAELVVAAFCRITQSELAKRYGTPLSDEGTPLALSVCALGKCGGRELGFASDIELMFIYSGSGRTTGPEVITATEYYLKLVEVLTQAVQTKHEGVFQIDLRLRPYGKGGSLAVSLDAFRSYFAADGAAWPYERQALVKLRAVAGDEQFGKDVETLRDNLIYTGTPFDVGAMRGMRERQIRQLVTPGTINAKFSPGGLVDVEYLVQGLQITHGHARPAIRDTNTLGAIQALEAENLLSASDAGDLRGAYIFFRRLIDALRVVRGDAKDLTVPPAQSEEFEFLARRLNYQGDTVQLRRDLADHAEHLLRINRRLQ